MRSAGAKIVPVDWVAHSVTPLRAPAGSVAIPTFDTGLIQFGDPYSYEMRSFLLTFLLAKFLSLKVAAVNSFELTFNT
jgi:hypothetical protein